MDCLLDCLLDWLLYGMMYCMMNCMPNCYFSGSKGLKGSTPELFDEVTACERNDCWLDYLQCGKILCVIVRYNKL